MENATQEKGSKETGIFLELLWVPSASSESTWQILRLVASISHVGKEGTGIANVTSTRMLSPRVNPANINSLPCDLTQTLDLT